MEIVISDARPDLTPRCLLILMATGTFVRQILTARATVEAARRYEFFVCFCFIHIDICANSWSIHIVASVPTKRSNT